jgi:Xaa-Pro aminopeptidase
VLNLRGNDIPFNPLFQAYFFVGQEQATLFVDKGKVNEDIGEYLKSVGVEVREYNDLWTFLRRREWGEGKVRPHL